LPTHTAVATFVEVPAIHVCTELSVVPVLPMYGVPSRGREAPAVPLITPAIAYAAVSATAGVTSDCPHSAFCPAISSPSAPMTAWTMIGLQYTPWLAIAA